MKKLLCNLILAGSAGTALAHNHSLKLDYDVRSSYNDHGLEKTDTVTPSKTMTFGQKAFLNLSGELDDGVSYKAYFNLLSTDVAGGTEVAMASKKFSDMLTVSVGKTYLNQGGYDNKNWGYNTLFVSPYTESHMALPTSATMMMLSANLGSAGELSLMLTDDVVGDGQNGFINTSKSQPATLLEWKGKFGAVSPLVQVVPYDNANSMQTSVGVAVNTSGVTAYLDYVMDSRKEMINGKKETHSYSNMVADVSYDAGYFKPFVKIAMFDLKQAKTDVKSNSPKLDANGNVSTFENFNDNASVMSLGSTVPGVSENFTPYFAFVSKSGKFFKTAAMTEEESKSSTTLVLGVNGSL